MFRPCVSSICEIKAKRGVAGPEHALVRGSLVDGDDIFCCRRSVAYAFPCISLDLKCNIPLSKFYYIIFVTKETLHFRNFIYFLFFTKTTGVDFHYSAEDLDQ